MRGKWFAAGILAAAGVLAWTAPSRAGDTIRLNGVANTPTQNLVDDGRGADTIATHYHGGFGRGFGYGGFGRGFGYGGYGGFGRGFGYGYGGFGRGLGFGYGGFGRGLGFGYGGFGRGLGLGYGYGGFGRGLGFGYGGFGRGFGYGYGGYGLGIGYGLGLGYGLGYGGFGYGGFSPGIGIGYGYGGYYPGFGYGGLYGCSGLSGSVYTLSMPVTNGISTPVAGSPQPGYTDVLPSQAVPDNGTYPYDGGPRNPVPAPQAAPTPPTGTQQRTVPLEGRSVSLPKPAAKWVYPAYGETTRRSSPAQERTFLAKSELKNSNAR